MGFGLAAVDVGGKPENADVTATTRSNRHNVLVIIMVVILLGAG